MYVYYLFPVLNKAWRSNDTYFLTVVFLLFVSLLFYLMAALRDPGYTPLQDPSTHVQNQVQPPQTLEASSCHLKLFFFFTWAFIIVSFTILASTVLCKSPHPSNRYPDIRLVAPVSGFQLLPPLPGATAHPLQALLHLRPLR